MILAIAITGLLIAQAQDGKPEARLEKGPQAESRGD